MIARSAIAYAAVSGLCIVLHNTIMIGGDWLGLSLIASVLVSFCVVALTGYLLHSLLTFREALSLVRLARYAAAMSMNIPLAYATLRFWHDLMHLEMIWASPAATLCMVACNFALSRWAILAKPKHMAVN
jgi:putative flippase GtrA